MPGHTKCCTCQAKSSHQPYRSDAPKMQPLSGNQRPNLLTSLMNMSLVLRLPREMHLSKCPTPAIVLGHATKPSRFAHFWQGAQTLAPATQNNIWTFKSGPSMRCLKHFDLEMCFAPRPGTLFQHLNFQKCSERDVFCAFWLRNVLRATTACTFSTSQLLKVLRTWCVLYILTSKCASRHNGMQFFISHLASLRTRRFGEPTFRPSGATNHWKAQWVATVLPFRTPASSFFWLFLFSDLLSSALLFCDSSHLCFSICPYCRKFDF